MDWRGGTPGSVLKTTKPGQACRVALAARSCPRLDTGDRLATQLCLIELYHIFVKTASPNATCRSHYCEEDERHGQEEPAVGIQAEQDWRKVQGCLRVALAVT